MKILFIINPKSGSATLNTLEELIRKEFSSAAFEYTIYRMSLPDEKRHLQELINTNTPDLVACAGGDGTVNLVAGLLLYTSIILAIIPLGSANGMAKELGISNVEHALQSIKEGRTRSIDVLKINDRLCVHLADVGFNARIVRRFEKDTRRGLLTYARHLFGELFLIKRYRFNLRIDGKSFTTKAVSVTFANASKYGTGAVINPVGKIDDGKFELVIIKPFPGVHLLAITWNMFRGTLHTSEYARIISCKEARIVSSRKTTLQVDGEVMGRIKEVNATILPGAIIVATP